jgi:hypothetical protein
MNVFLIDQLKLAQDNLSIALAALEKISDPIGFLQKESEKDGSNLDGIMALNYANNAANLQAIAEQALNRIRNK